MTGVPMIPLPDPRFEEALGHFRQANYPAAIRLWKQMAEDGLGFPDLDLYLHAAEVEYRRVLDLVEDLASHLGGSLPALEECRRVVAEHPEYADWQYRRSVLAASLGLLPEALGAIEAALEVNPSLGKAWHQKAVLLRRQGDDRTACDALRQAAACSAETDRSACAQAERLAESGLYQDAAALWFSAIRFAPDYASRHIEAGRRLFGEGKLDEAERELEAGLSMAPQYADGHYYLGLIAIQRGRPKEAIDLLKTSLSLGPSHAHAALELAGAYLAAGFRDAARDTLQVWEARLENSPGHRARLAHLHEISRRPPDKKKTKATKERTQKSETTSARPKGSAPRRRKTS